MQQMKGFVTVQAVHSARNGKREGHPVFGWLCVSMFVLLTVCMIVSFVRHLRHDREVRKYLQDRWSSQR